MVTPVGALVVVEPLAAALVVAVVAAVVDELDAVGEELPQAATTRTEANPPVASQRRVVRPFTNSGWRGCGMTTAERMKGIGLR